MNRIFKTLLLWLLAVALPMQATAAVVKASCGSAHHAAQTQVAVSGSAMSAHAHHHDEMQMHGHPMLADDDASMHEGAVNADLSVHQVADTAVSALHAEHGHSTCSACAACCVGAAAPPTAAIKTFEPDFVERFVPGLSSRLANYIPPSLERPPRHPLA